jgi:hypothetical protein
MRASTARIIARAGPLGARAHTNALVAYRATVRRTVSSAMPCGARGRCPGRSAPATRRSIPEIIRGIVPCISHRRYVLGLGCWSR